MLRSFARVLVLLAPFVPHGFGRDISVAELNYSPLGGSDYEYIELVNPGTKAITLTGAKFTAGITYTFGTTVLQPNDRIVVCGDRTKFIQRYGSIPQLAPGQFTGNLNDAGEKITLLTALNAQLLSFTYDSAGDWPSRANGLGSSLEAVDPNGNLDDPLNWRSSAEYNGSPGRAGVGQQRTVVINEVLAHTDPPLEDAIELYNNSTAAVNLSGWYLSNSRSEPMKYRIPASTTIAPHSFLVFYEYQFGQAGDPKAFTFNSAHGDEAVLLSTDASGNPLLWMDATSFDASENGYSFARYPNGTGPLLIQGDLSLGSEVRSYYPAAFLNVFRTGLGESNKPPRVGPLVISQIQYAPPAGKDEYIAIDNPTVFDVPLFDPAFPTNHWKLADGISFTFPSDITLAAGGRLIVCATNPAAFRAHQSVPASVQVFGPWSGQLNNTGDRITLLKPDATQGPQHPDFGFVPYILVEQIDYLDAAPWPVGPASGYVIQRKTIGYGNDPTNWFIEDGPAPTISTSAALVGNSIRLRFNVPANYTASIETRRAYDSGAWATVQTYPAQAADRTQEWLYTIEGATRGFRVSVSR